MKKKDNIKQVSHRKSLRNTLLAISLGGRKKKKVSVYIDPEILEVLEEYCKEFNSNKSEIFRLLIQEFLLNSELLNLDNKKRVAKISPISCETYEHSKVIVGVKPKIENIENIDLFKLVKNINDQRPNFSKVLD